MYLINGEGKVAMVNVGYNDDIGKSLLENIRKAIGEPVTDPVPDSIVKYVTGQKGESSVDIKGDGTAANANAAATGDKPADAATDAAADTGKDATKAKGKAKAKAKGKGKKKGK